MPEGAEGVELAWTSSDDKIATVDKDGNVKAVAEGTATLTVTATQGSGDGAVTKTATVDVTVIKDGGTDPEPEKPVVLTGVKASVKKADLKVGETTKATAKITPEKAENVTFAWASSDKKVATVDADGNVKAVGKGTAKLTVTATQGSGADAVKVTDTVKVTVTKGRRSDTAGGWKDTSEDRRRNSAVLPVCTCTCGRRSGHDHEKKDG